MQGQGQHAVPSEVVLANIALVKTRRELRGLAESLARTEVADGHDEIIEALKAKADELHYGNDFGALANLRRQKARKEQGEATLKRARVTLDPEEVALEIARGTFDPLVTSDLC